MPRRKSPGPPPRNQRGPREREARSQTLQRIAEQDLLRGSLVRMERTCGKENCRCQQGKKHAAWYLAIRLDQRRAMIYIPKALEETVRRWVETGQEVEGLLEAISQECLQTFLAKKAQALARKPKKEKPP